MFVSDNSNGQNWGCFSTSKELRKLLQESAEIHRSKFISELNIERNKFIYPNKHDIRFFLGTTQKIGRSDNKNYKKVYSNMVDNIGHFFDYVPKTVNQFASRADKFIKDGKEKEYFGDLSDISHIVINGEGSIHDRSMSSYRRKAWILLFIAYVSKQKLGMRTHIVNHTLQIQTDRLQKIIEYVYPKLDSIIFRDPLSVKEYESKIGIGNVIEAADAAWLFNSLIGKQKLREYHDSSVIDIWHPDPRNFSFDFSQPYICIGGSSGFKQSRDRLVELFTEITHNLQHQLEEDILLTAAGSDDESVMLQVSERTGSGLVKLNNSPTAAASILGNSELYLGGRWHPSIFSLIGGANLVSISGNTFKINAIKKQFNSDHPIFCHSNISKNIDDIVSRVVSELNSDSGSIELTKGEIHRMRKLAKKNNIFNSIE